MESLETLPISDTLHPEDVLAVAQDAVAVAIGWEVEGYEELETAETSPDVELKMLLALTLPHCRNIKRYDSVCIFSFSFPAS